jgi:hypothetical protein
MPWDTPELNPKKKTERHEPQEFEMHPITDDRIRERLMASLGNLSLKEVQEEIACLSEIAKNVEPPHVKKRAI